MASDTSALTSPTSTTHPAPPPHRYDWNRTDQRLSMPASGRAFLATTIGFLSGMTLGLSHGSQMAGLRFRAENAHRLPKSQTGWYLYHKSKNYHLMLGGLKEGLKMGGKVGVWVGGFTVMEEAVDRFRGGRRDFGSTLVAVLGTSGAFSLWNRFPLVTAARTAKTALVVGLVYGLAQDALSLARGRKLGYVEFIRGLPARLRGEKRQT